MQAILTDYLAAKLHRPVVGLTRPALTALLLERRVAATTTQRTLDCLTAAEQLRFSPATVERDAADSLLDTVEATVVVLDEALA